MRPIVYLILCFASVILSFIFACTAMSNDQPPNKYTKRVVVSLIGLAMIFLGMAAKGLM